MQLLLTLSRLCNTSIQTLTHSEIFIDILVRQSKAELDSMHWFSHRRGGPCPRGQLSNKMLYFFVFLSPMTFTFDLWLWHSNSGKIVAVCTWPPSFTVLLPFGSYRVDKQTNWQTDKQTRQHAL